MKRVFIIHGWGGHPEDHWQPWLRQELEREGFSVIAPQMPDTDNPKVGEWVSFLAKTVGKPDKDTYFVGHSMGCKTILLYLQSIDVQVGGALMVAGFWSSIQEEKMKVEENRLVLEPWLAAPVDPAKVRRNAKSFVCIFSDNDQWIPIETAQVYKEKLGAKIVIEKGKGHFGSRDNPIRELPIVLEELLKITH